jgi:hypothetical protein
VVYKVALIYHDRTEAYQVEVPSNAPDGYKMLQEECPKVEYRRELSYEPIVMSDKKVLLYSDNDTILVIQLGDVIALSVWKTSDDANV